MVRVVSRRWVAGAGLCAAASALAPRVRAQTSSPDGDDIAGVPRARFARLVSAYPDHLARIEGEALIWTDGVRTALDDGVRGKSFEQMLRNASLADQLRQTYRPGRPTAAPAPDDSPGRIRNAPFFAKMYGDCSRNEVVRRMRPVTWMPRTRPQRLQVTTVNDVAGRLERVIAELERLPDRLKAQLVPSAGVYNCRVVADTGQPSMHAYGAAIDIATAQTDYWVWARRQGSGKGSGKGAGAVPYRNRIAWEIAEIFEAERFVWGAKWYHYDTMHFEYRPELFAA